ncbi:putative sterigmatocystin 8-o-methyltransferase [Phaeomoniella chlamydospora]|uniref:Putative sterigmatocystin 8-o-methyltransferase n=1 Tax=Phaeomoniella chlamydospora TaxID=158046 RepID=A0A0G2EDW5_PHACM|nr:putative sterigmatocystin 8-o-methyltransferase [Phaeomoniella chlamydospora]
MVLSEQTHNVSLIMNLHPIYSMCVRLAIDLDLFTLLLSRSEITTAQIAEFTGSQEDFIGMSIGALKTLTDIKVRLMRIVSGVGFVTEVGEKTYFSNIRTKALSKPAVAASMVHFFDQGIPVLQQMRGYFKQHGYRNPEDVRCGPYQYTHHTSQETYAHWQSQPDVGTNFNLFMSDGKLTDKRKWFEWVPTDKVLIEGFRHSDAAPLLVDVGGGCGHDLAALSRRYPNLPGRLVLQDLPHVINDVPNLDEMIEKMPYDFLTPQPVKAGLDFAMMFWHAGMERSEEEWRKLLRSEDLQITNIWHNPAGDGTIIEAMVSDTLLKDVVESHYHCRMFSI